MSHLHYSLTPRSITRAAIVGGQVFLLAALFGCGADERVGAPIPATAPTPSRSPSPFAVSAPYINAGDTPVVDDGAALGLGTVYVALPQGSIPDAQLVTIASLRTGNSIVASAVDGGLDPVVIDAVAGDELIATVLLAGGDSRRYALPVPFAGSPVVIRMSPPANMMDVPLDASMRVVFSEPIAASSLSSASLQLWSGSAENATQVSGDVAFSDDSRLTMIFTPAAALDPATTYTLSVGSDIRDALGAIMNAAVAIEFTTVDAVPAEANRLRAARIRPR